MFDPLIVPIFASNLIAYLLVLWLANKRGWHYPSLLAMATAALLHSLLFIVSGNVGHTWNVASFVGKSAAVIMGFWVPLACCSFVLAISRPPTIRKSLTIAAITGVIASLAAPFIVLYAIALFTGDAL